MKVIAFGYERNVGKDTAGKFLCTHLRTTKKWNTIRKGFADKLKDQCYDLYKWAGLQPRDYYDLYPEQKEVVLPALGMSPREVWIKYGTTVCREIHSKTWVYQLLKINSYNCDLMVITDVRFPEEADTIIDEFQGHVFHIERPNRPKLNMEYQKIVDIADAPLRDYKRFSGVIHNEGSLQDFHTVIVNLCKEFYGG